MWNNTDTPLAYLISFHSYGTWLHGDERGSIDRFHNKYRTPRIQNNLPWCEYNETTLRATPLILGPTQRRVVKEAIVETCNLRQWALLAFNVRTNHVHVVVSAPRKGEVIRDTLKANATRRLREDGLWKHPFSAWVQKGSVRNLWNEESLARAINYVLNGQGDDLPDY